MSPVQKANSAQDVTFRDQCMKLEQRTMELERKNSHLFSQNKECRRQFEKKEKEAAALHLRVDKLTEMLRAAELGRKVSEEYTRKLEAKFEKSGRGVALLKAARLQSELEGAQQQNHKLADVISCKNTETDRLTLTISTLEYTLARTAQGLGLPDGQALSDYLQLKDRTAAQQQELHRKENTISSLMDELAAADARGQSAAALQQQVAELQQAVQGQQQAAAEALNDKNTVLDYVQELQDERDRLLVEGRDCSSAAKQARAEVERLQCELQAAASGQQQAQAQVDKLQHALTCSGIAAMQQKLSAAEALCRQRDADLQEQQHSNTAALQALQQRVHDKELQLASVAMHRDQLQRQVIEVEALRARIDASLHEQHKHLAEQQQQAAALQAHIQSLEGQADSMQRELKQKDAVCHRVGELEAREALLLKLVDELRSSIASLERQLLGKAEEQEGAELLCGDLVHAIRIHRSGASAAACPPVTTPTRMRLAEVGTEVRLLLEDLGRAGQQLRVGRDLQEEVARQAEGARSQLADTAAHIGALEAEKRHLLAQLEDARNEAEGLRQEHLALVKQMERQLRTLCEIEALLPSHLASASRQASESLEERLVAEVRQCVQEAAATRAQHQQVLERSASTSQQLQATRDELTAMELVVKPAKRKLEEQFEEAARSLAQLRAEKVSLAEALQRERERARLLEAGFRSQAEALESSAAHSTAKLAATSREAQEALAMERQHSRNLQLEVERLRVTAEEQEREARAAVEAAKQAEAQLQQERRFQVTELRASLRARQARVKELEQQQDTGRNQTRPTASAWDATARAPSPPSPMPPKRALPQAEAAQLVHDISRDLASSSSDEEDDGGPAGRPSGRRGAAARAAGPSTAPQQQQQQQQQQQLLSPRPSLPRPGATPQLDRNLAASFARSFRQSASARQPLDAPGQDAKATSIATASSTLVQRSQRNVTSTDRPQQQQQQPRQSSDGFSTPPPSRSSGLRRSATAGFLSPPSSSSPEPAAPRALSHSVTAIHPLRPSSSSAASSALPRQAHERRPSTTDRIATEAAALAGRRQVAPARSLSSSALLQQLQQLHASHRELRGKFQRALSRADER